MTWRRSKTNAQQVRWLRRMNEQLRRAEDERLARLVVGGAR